MADPDPSLTPEQKLLKIIEQGGAEAGKPAAGPSQSDQGSAQKKSGGFNLATILSPSAIKGRIQFAKDWIQGYAKGKKDPIDLRKVNRVVKVMTAGFAVYLSVAIVSEIINVNHSYQNNFALSPKEIAEPPEIETNKIDPSLFEEVEKRNVFIPQDKRQAASGAAEETSNPVKLLDLIKDLKLTGISINPADETKSYCMVEDIQKSVTSFLKVGDMVSGLRVEQINSDGIVLKHGNDSIELR